MKNIILLDLCCKAGGAAMGYYMAAQELGLNIIIVGVDIEHQENYPFEFVQMDAVKFLKKYHKYFTHVHASPPCQAFSVSTALMRAKGKKYKNNLDQVRKLMYKIGKPGIIENVPTAPIRPDIILRGDMFGLKVLRKRYFELVNWFMLNPYLPHKIGSVKAGDFAQVVGNGNLITNHGNRVKIKGNTVNEVWSKAMNIDWMKTKELAEAIPPSYTKYIGKEFFKINSHANKTRK